MAGAVLARPMRFLHVAKFQASGGEYLRFLMAGSDRDRLPRHRKHSPAFVRAPEGNGCAEQFIRTLKENLLWVRTFATIEDLRQALLAFRETDNTTWLIERHGFLTPALQAAKCRILGAAARGSAR